MINIRSATSIHPKTMEQSIIIHPLQIYRERETERYKQKIWGQRI